MANAAACAAVTAAAGPGDAEGTAGPALVEGFCWGAASPGGRPSGVQPDSGGTGGSSLLSA